MVERFVSIEEAAGSMPAFSTFLIHLFLFIMKHSHEYLQYAKS